jgi:DNA-binding HxlR family transcriptional regulator
MGYHLIANGISVLNPDCPSRRALNMLADKWTMLVIVALKDGAKRNGALKRMLGDISQKMLTQTLRELEASGIVARVVYDQVPPHVEYHLTDLGRTLLIPISALRDWAELYYDEVAAAQQQARENQPDRAV